MVRRLSGHELDGVIERHRLCREGLNRVLKIHPTKREWENVPGSGTRYNRLQYPTGSRTIISPSPTVRVADQIRLARREI